MIDIAFVVAPNAGEVCSTGGFGFEDCRWRRCISWNSHMFERALDLIMELLKVH